LTMRRSLLVVALAMGGVLLFDAAAWAPQLYGLRLENARGYPRAIVRTVAITASDPEPTARQEQYAHVVAGTTLAATGSYDFEDTKIEGEDNPTRKAVEQRCTHGNRIVLTSQRVEPPPDGVAEDALAEPAVATIQDGNPPTFELELPIVDNARGEYYLRVRCVTPEALKQEGVEGAPQEAELEQLGEFLDTREAQRTRPFKPFRNFGTNLYVWPKEG
jgi:hypothetical protein